MLNSFPPMQYEIALNLAAKGAVKAECWKDKKDKIYEWDSPHGAVKIHDNQGKHLGEFNPDTGKITKPPKSGRTTPRQIEKHMFLKITGVRA